MGELPRVISSDTLRDVRIPPRQAETRKWPVLHAGNVPKVDLATWDFRVEGLVAEPRRWSWDEFRQLPATEVFADMHCVTRWSQLNMQWTGVLVRDVMRQVAVLPEAKFVMVHAEHGWTTNLPLADFLADDAVFAWAANGTELTPDHGWPLRLVIPKLYAWKSAKWVRRVELMPRDRPGYWEQGGYHMRGDPWREERFSW
jgi:DMSO/TMAO reductase YedYZ molybdopterin-dependent catalytic subunit